jgi:uncharacterized protein (DUF1501 family)
MLHTRLIEGLETQEMAMSESNNKKAKFKDLATSCGRLLAQDNRIDCAMLEVGGWDTHNNQANRLTNKLKELDSGLAALKENLAESWENTVVIVATEFSRTAKENGTKGTDHGTASAMFIAGGNVAGGRVTGRWPGLKSKQLFENRDLQPTSNSISWISTVLKQQWKMSDAELAKVFPSSKVYKVKVLS